MKQNAISRTTALLVVLALPWVSASAQAEYGKLRFGCQVTTTGEKQGYISVRAHTKEDAVAAAGRVQKVPTRLGTQEPVKAVVECVQIPGGRFTDTGFQTWVDEVLPR
jgi:hypothetical protein